MKRGFGLGGWERLRVQQKVWIVVLALSLPLLSALVFQVTLIQQLRTLQEHHQQTRLVRDHVRILARLAVDIVRKVRVGRAAEVLQYVRSGEGLALSDQLLREIRTFEDRLTLRVQSFQKDEEALARRAFWGLLLAVAGGLALA